MIVIPSNTSYSQKGHLKSVHEEEKPLKCRLTLKLQKYNKKLSPFLMIWELRARILCPPACPAIKSLGQDGDQRFKENRVTTCWAYVSLLMGTFWNSKTFFGDWRLGEQTG